MKKKLLFFAVSVLLPLAMGALTLPLSSSTSMMQFDDEGSIWDSPRMTKLTSPAQESFKLPAYELLIFDLVFPEFVKADQDINYTFKIRNLGSKKVAPNLVKLLVTVDGDSVDMLTNESEFFTKAIDMSGTISTVGLSAGEHRFAITIASLDGQPLEEPQSLETVFKMFTRVMPRQKHLIEQFTSNTCTYCPLGSSMLEILLGKRDDLIRVAIHGNLSSKDPANTKQCDSIFSLEGAEGWPYGSFDRATGFAGPNAIVTGLGYYEEYHEQVADELCDFFDSVTENMPSFASIDGTCEVNPITREATISIFGDISPDFEVMMGEDAKLNVFIIEDSLIYRQLNLGNWDAQYHHDGVFRLALGSVYGVDINKEGETYQNDFSLILPNEWNLDNLHVAAFISRPLENGKTGNYPDMFVNNAEKFDFYVLPATAAPEIAVEVTDESVIITATGEGEVLLYVDGELVENPYTIARSKEDVTINVVATAQDGDKLMNTTTQVVTVPAIVDQAVDELMAGKTIAGVRYYNLMGQEMTDANGATIVVTTYTDGTTRVTKVMR